MRNDEGVGQRALCHATPRCTGQRTNYTNVCTLQARLWICTFRASGECVFGAPGGVLGTERQLLKEHFYRDGCFLALGLLEEQQAMVSVCAQQQ